MLSVKMSLRNFIRIGNNVYNRNYILSATLHKNSVTLNFSAHAQGGFGMVGNIISYDRPVELKFKDESEAEMMFESVFECEKISGYNTVD